MTGTPREKAALPLFRAEAQRNNADRVFGSVLLAAPVAFSVVTAAVTLVALIIIAIVVFGRYTQRETVSGFVAVSAGEVRVFPQAAGTVSEILVAEGAQVSAGSPLISLMTARSDRMSAAASAAVLDAVIAEKSALDRQLTEQRQYFSKESDRLELVEKNTTRLIQSLRRQQELAVQRLAVARRDIKRAQSMRDRNFLSARDHDALLVAAVDSELAVESTASRLAEFEAERQDAHARLEQLEHLRNTRLSEIEESSGRLAQRLAAVRAGLVQQIVAPIEGQVSALHVTPGQTVSSETLVLVLMPLSASLHAELLVPGRSIGFLDAQQAVALRFDAYPSEKYGAYAAQVDRSAGSLIFPGDLRLPIAIGEPVYRVRAILERQHVEIEGKSRPLTAGMTFKADLLLSERSLLEWMMAPVLGTRSRP